MAIVPASSNGDSQFSDGLRLEGLGVTYRSAILPTVALRAVTLSVARGQSVCLVGASGAGKSSLLNAILGLLPDTADIKGHIQLPSGPTHHGQDSDRLQAYRRRSVGTIFQDPIGSLMPGVPILRQVSSAFQVRHGLSKSEATLRARDALARAGLSHDAEYAAVPAELSGGMCQRVSVALALSAPDLRLLLADEPTSNLDSVMAAQIIDLLFEVQAQSRAILLFITHDIRLHSRFHSVGVLSKGEIKEVSTSSEFSNRAGSEEGRQLIAASRKLGALR